MASFSKCAAVIFVERERTGNVAFFSQGEHGAERKVSSAVFMIHLLRVRWCELPSNYVTESLERLPASLLGKCFPELIQRNSLAPKRGDAGGQSDRMGLLLESHEIAEAIQRAVVTRKLILADNQIPVNVQPSVKDVHCEL